MTSRVGRTWAFAEMPGFGAAIAGAKDNMNVERRFAFGIVRYVPDHRRHFDLFADRNLSRTLSSPN